jgi:hypothetical protein
MDKDKKVVNTEEQNRAVNPGDSVIQEDSISQDSPEKVSNTGNANEPGKPEGGVETDKPQQVTEQDEERPERDYPDL